MDIPFTRRVTQPCMSACIRASRLASHPESEGAYTARYSVRSRGLQRGSGSCCGNSSPLRSLKSTAVYSFISGGLSSSVTFVLSSGLSSQRKAEYSVQASLPLITIYPVRWQPGYCLSFRCPLWSIIATGSSIPK